MTTLALIAWILLPVTGASMVFWIIVATRVGRMQRDDCSVRAGLDPPCPEDAVHADGDGDSDAPLVSIVIPAHNEERVIDACAASLRKQTYERLEIIFVLDRCTDGTLAILERHRAEEPRLVIVENESCPDTWAGKCHAASLGARRARGEYVLFTDADTVFDPDLVRASVAVVRHRDLGLLSLLSNLTFEHRFERIAQPVATMNLVRMYPLDRVNRRTDARPFANGQFMLFDRTWYDRLGGHEAVKDDLLEDIAFARALKRAGGAGELLLADGMLTCSMYDSLEALRVGWKRIFIEACKRKPARLRTNGARVMAIGVLMPLLQLMALAVAAVLLATLPVLAIGLVALVGAGWTVQLAALMHIYNLAGAPRSATIFYPLGCWIVARIMLEGASDLAHRRPIRWCGRQYVLEPR